MTKQNCVNSSLTAHGIQVADAAGVGCTSTTLTDGQLLIGSSGAAPAAATLTAGAGIQITPGAGSLTITNIGGGGGGVVSITGVNGLDATDTGGGAYEVGVAADNAVAYTKGFYYVRSGDQATTSGDISLSALALAADPNGSGNITLQASALDNAGGNFYIEATGGTGFSGGNFEVNVGPGHSNSGNIWIHNRAIDAAFTGAIQLRTAQADNTSALPAQVILDAGQEGNYSTPSDTSIRLRRTGEVTPSISDMDLRAVTITTYGDTFTVNPTLNAQPFAINASNEQWGTATLSSGTVTVGTSWVTPTNVIMVCHKTISGTLGHLGAVAGTGDFTITSYKSNGTTETSDTSTVQYWII